jgi:uncharacterized membrane protein
MTHSFSVRARLFPQALLLALSIMLGACVQQTAPTPASSSPALDLAHAQGHEITWLYTCTDGGQFTARFHKDQVRLFLPGRSLLLTADTATDAQRYRTSTQTGEAQFLSKGQNGTLQVPGQSDRHCTGGMEPGPWEKAARMGVTFRAAGFDPEWVLDITGEGRDKSIAFSALTIGGHQRFPWKEPERNGDRLLWNIPAHGEILTVLVAPRPCTAPMSNQTFPQSVTVMLGDETFQGCGRPLSDALY